GKPYSEVFTSFKYEGRPYNVLLHLPPTHGDPESYSFTSVTEGILMLSEYQDLWTDLQNELNGVRASLPTLARSDPSPWDHWNELNGKPWSAGFFRNEDDSPVLNSPHSHLQSGNDAVGDEDGDATIEALKRRKRPRRDVSFIVPPSECFKYLVSLVLESLCRSMLFLLDDLWHRNRPFCRISQTRLFSSVRPEAYEVRVAEEPDWAKKLMEEELFLFDSNEEVVQPANFLATLPNPDSCGSFSQVRTYRIWSEHGIEGMVYAPNVAE
ncbi:hypothetical protein K435DRAFT_890431, partial [Dendrothele bispora CBS 962.96]